MAKNGDDICGNGSVIYPFQTIQRAIQEAELSASQATPQVIYVFPGKYTENLTLTTGYTHITGLIPFSEIAETTKITGTITITGDGVVDLYNRQFGFYSLQITGSLTDNLTKSHSLLIKDCQFYYPDRAVYVNSTGADQRTFISRCKFNQSSTIGGNPTIQINKGWLAMDYCKVDRRSNSNLLSMTGDSYLNVCANCLFESSSTIASLKPVISINSTSTAPHTVSYSGIVVSSTTTKTDPTCSGIAVLSVGSTIIVMFNTFSIGGISHTGTPPTYVIYGVAGSACIDGGSYALPTTENRIGGGISHGGALSANLLS